MGVFLCLNIKSHEFSPGDSIIENIDKFTNKGVNPLDLIYEKWKLQEEEEEKENGIVVLLGESKHKIKKKAEQEACRISIEKLV